MSMCRKVDLSEVEVEVEGEVETRRGESEVEGGSRRRHAVSCAGKRKLIFRGREHTGFILRNWTEIGTYRSENEEYE